MYVYTCEHEYLYININTIIYPVVAYNYKLFLYWHLSVCTIHTAGIFGLEDVSSPSHPVHPQIALVGDHLALDRSHPGSAVLLGLHKVKGLSWHLR